MAQKFAQNSNLAPRIKNQGSKLDLGISKFKTKVLAFLNWASGLNDEQLWGYLILDCICYLGEKAVTKYFKESKLKFPVHIFNVLICCLW